MADNNENLRRPEPPGTETLLSGPTEVVIKTPAVTISIVVNEGQTAGIATRTAETPDGGVRTLTTIRTGPELEKVVFNFGNYGSGGSGPQTFGGDPGNGPPCP